MKSLVLAGALSFSALMAATAMAQDGTTLTGKDAYGNWEKDAPGVMRHLTAKDLEAPQPQQSASNSPSTVPMPAGAMPKVPAGFKVEMVASGIENPRAIRFAPNGDLFVGNSKPAMCWFTISTRAWPNPPRKAPSPTG